MRLLLYLPLNNAILPPLSIFVTMEMAPRTRHNQHDGFLPETNPSFAGAAFYRKRKAWSHHQCQVCVGRAAHHRGQGKLQPVLPVSVLLCDTACGTAAWATVLCSMGSPLVPNLCCPSKLSEQCSAWQHLAGIATSVKGGKGVDVAVIFWKQCRSSAE